MQNRKNYLIVLLSFLITSQVYGGIFQKKPKTGMIPCSDFQVSKPLRDIAKEHPVDESRPVIKKEESKDKENRRPQKFRFTVKDGYRYANDTLTVQKRMGNQRGRAPVSNWNGQTASGFRPFDPSGAAGPLHYVQIINSTTFKVYDKSTGAVILTATLGNLWTPATPNNGDPIVMYDKAADRWFLAQFGSSTNKRIYIAISTSGDPTGTYYTYTYTSPEFPDYLKFSVWSDGYYMTSNQTQKVFAFERAAMLAGNANARAVYTFYSPPQGNGFFCPLPGDAADGSLPPAGTPCPIFSCSDNGWGAGFDDAVNIYQMAVNWTPATPTATITAAGSIPTAAFDASYDANWNDISQPGTTQKLDAIGGVCMYRAQWKSWNGYNTILLNWSVKISSTQRSIKWCELRQDQATGTWSMYQEGIYTPDAATRWMGSIAMDNNGSIGLAYMKVDSAAGLYAGLYYTGRRVCDPPGTLPVTEETVAIGTGSQTGTNRNGDYAHMALDPDGLTFWYTGEYMGGTTGSSAARTRIFSFQIPACENAVTSTINITSGSNPICAGTSTTFTATVTNGGSNPSYQWQIDGVNVGTNSPTFTTSSITNGQVVRCIVTSNQSRVNNNPATSNGITMVVNPVVTPTVSINLTSGSNPSCSGSAMTFTATPVNGGTIPAYQWKVNGSNVGSNSSTFSSLNLTNGQIITCELTTNATCATATTATSNAITATILTPGNPTTTITQIAGSNPLCSGSTATFSATVTGGTATNYQWKINGVNAGTNSSTFSTNTLTNGQAITCTVTANATCPILSSYTVGNGNLINATTTSLAAPYPTYYGNARQQYLIRASELTSSGMTAGPIQSIGFTVTGSAGNPTTLNGYTIKIGTTSSTAYSSATFLTSAFTTVFGPVNYTPVTGGLNSHTFSSPFNWNGTSNLLIDICFSNQVTGVAAYQTRNTPTGWISTAYYNADGIAGAGSCAQARGTSTGSRRPNMTFRFGSTTVTVNSNSIAMAVVNAPTVSSFSPFSGNAGTMVTINGSNLNTVTQVSFNGINATSFSIVNSNQLTAIVPNGGNGSIVLTTNSCDNINAGTFTLLPTDMNLNVQVFIEGFYRGRGTMTSILSAGQTDTITVQLASSIAPYSMVKTAKGILSTTGTAAFTFTGIMAGSSYYIIIKHRNSIETWSAIPVSFSNLTTTYDFTSAASVAYGNNLKSMGDGKFALYSGDVNQNGTIEQTDLHSVETEALLFNTGYYTGDLTGDMIVESADYSLVENNVMLNISLARP